MTSVHVLHFWSPTCGPCMAIKPALEVVKEDFEGTIDWISINTKEDPKKYAARFGISVVPTIIVFKGDTEIGRYSGTQIAIIYTLIRKGLAA
jgi:thioredoxin-like negative regulator of GroEL